MWFIIAFAVAATAIPIAFEIYFKGSDNILTQSASEIRNSSLVLYLARLLRRLTGSSGEDQQTAPPMLVPQAAGARYGVVVRDKQTNYPEQYERHKQTIESRPLRVNLARQWLSIGAVFPALTLVVYALNTPEIFLHLHNNRTAASLLTSFAIVYGAIAPLTIGLISRLISLQIDGGEMAEAVVPPSQWMLTVGGAASFVAAALDSTGRGLNHLAAGIAVLAVTWAFATFACRLIVSILNMRPPRLTLARMPPECWAWLVASAVFLCASLLVLSLGGLLIFGQATDLEALDLQWRGLVSLSIGAMESTLLLGAVGFTLSLRSGSPANAAEADTRMTDRRFPRTLLVVAGLCIVLQLGLRVLQLLDMKLAPPPWTVNAITWPLFAICLLCLAAVLSALRRHGARAAFIGLSLALFAAGLAEAALTHRAYAVSFCFFFAAMFYVWAIAYRWFPQFAPIPSFLPWVHLALLTLIAAPGLVDHVQLYTSSDPHLWMPPAIVMLFASMAGVGLLHACFGIGIVLHVRRFSQALWDPVPSSNHPKGAAYLGP
ncbi:hypothetical protein [Variovorax sp. OV329]|uniref:hypothetical protein n=1 Tax=Variovorax sp. OV329 TaxID=1882825 RepID=UPI0008F05AA7|nr:hypothetical protein [Variovorax sp. OV329]SFN54954.1 hypothetical protein SAMN05444747_1382 [Variovorax sp. OV329]